MPVYTFLFRVGVLFALVAAGTCCSGANCYSSSNVQSITHIDNLVIMESSAIYSDLSAGFSSGSGRMEAVAYATSALLSHYQDNFDIVYVQPYREIDGNGNYGQYSGGSVPVALSRENGGTLRGFVALPMYDSHPPAIPMMHELFHHWGIFLGSGNPGGMGVNGESCNDCYFSHWGFTAMPDDHQGMLGGYPRSTFKCVSPAGRIPTRSQSCNKVNGRYNLQPFASSLGRVASSYDTMTFSKFELMMMGLYTPQELSSEDDAVYCYNPEVVYSSSTGLFSTVACKELKFYSASEINSNSGVDPMKKISSGSNLRAAVVIVYPPGANAPSSSAQLRNDANANWMNEYLDELSGRFSAATDGRATISFDVRSSDQGCGLSSGCVGSSTISRTPTSSPVSGSTRAPTRAPTGGGGGSSVSCGQHTAPTCAECPNGNGAGWCNGACTWDYSQGICNDVITPAPSPPTGTPMIGSCAMGNNYCQQLLDGHNRQRRTLASSSNMVEMTWDSNLAAVAQAYLNAGSPQGSHNPDRSSDFANRGGSGYVGENWYSGAPTDAAEKWTTFVWPVAWGGNGCSEEENYHGTRGCSGTTGHYTQVMWASSTTLGCGYTSTGGTLCNYAPGGNYNGAAVLQNGVACSNCPSAFPSCNQGLCSSSSGGGGSTKAPTKAPTNSGGCVDLTLSSGAVYADSSGDTCARYAANNWCAQYGGTSANQGMVADQACCACGGGSSGSTPTRSPTKKPTRTPTKAPVNGGGNTWTGSNLKATHFWDCNGMGCDAATLQPWNQNKYVAAPGYSPISPDDFGGSQYGEKMWMVGAASDYLANLLGDDDSCCGHESSGQSGCGKCLLIQNPDSVNSDWTAVVMKKNRCPPNSPGCEAGKAHFDLAVPGFDNLQYSTANVCGQRPGTPSRQASSVMGSWYTQYSNTAQAIAGCDSLPQNLRAGCKLFASWGWESGNPSQIKYRTVTCPPKFKQHVAAQFDANGVSSSQPTKSPVSSPTKQPTRSPIGCADLTLSSGAVWADSSSDKCAGYVANAWCTAYGDGSANGGLTANQACCGCGGGSSGPTPTRTPTRSPTRKPTRSPTKSPVNPTRNPTKSPTEPPTEPPNCVDRTLNNGAVWHDADLAGFFGCAMYQQHNWCAAHGNTYPREDLTANIVCCVCGGGNVNTLETANPTLAPTQRPTRSPTIKANKTRRRRNPVRRRRKKASIKRRLRQQLRFENLKNSAAYNNDAVLKAAYELGFGMMIDAADVNTMEFKAGCSVTSVASGRRSTTIEFTAEVDETAIETGQVSEDLLNEGATESDFAEDMVLVTALPAYSTVSAPDESEITVASELELDDCDNAECTLETAEDGDGESGGGDNAGMITGAVVGVIGGIGLVTVGAFVFIKWKAAHSKDVVDLEEVNLEKGSKDGDTHKAGDLTDLDSGMFGETIEDGPEDLTTPLTPKSAAIAKETARHSQF